MNYTEDDTFDRLRRPSYEEVRELYFRSDARWTGSTITRIDWMKKYNWTWKEFYETSIQRGLSTSSSM